MAINLSKGQTINLNKSEFNLSRVTIGLGWDVKKQGGGGMFGGMFGGKKGEDYDLDAIAFLLGADDKIINLGDQKLVGGDVIFFNNLRHSSGHIFSSGDNRTGAGDGDDEQIIVNLDGLGQQYHKILFSVVIYQGHQKKQHFGEVANAYIRAVDAAGKEIARYSLSTDASFNGMCSMVFAEVYRKDGGWKVRAVGNPMPADNFVEILRGYVRTA